MRGEHHAVDRLFGLVWLTLGGLLLAVGCSDDDTESCLTNQDCDSNVCVNGLCVPEQELPDANALDGAMDAGRDVEDVDASMPDAGADTNGCVPWTCDSLGQVCRSADDGCGGSLDCGTPGTVTHRALEWGATQYLNWTFAAGQPEERIDHELCFDEVPSNANGFGRGMFFQVYDGAIEGQGFYMGYQDRVTGLDAMRNASGALFSKFGDRDATHLRPGPTAIVVNDDSEGGFISLRMPLDLTVGCYSTTLLRGDAENGGDWVIVRIEAGGRGFELGQIWFERTTPEEPIRFPNGGTWIEFFGFAGRTSDEVPRYDLRVSVLGDGEPPSSMQARYHRLAGDNSSSEYLPESDEVRMLVGGDAFRCVPGSLVGDFYETRWDVPR